MNLLTLFVVAHVYCLPGKVSEILQIFEKLATETRNEPGCIMYHLHQNTMNETQLTFIEEWTNEEALQQHFETDHFKRAVAQIQDLLAKPSDILQYRRLF